MPCLALPRLRPLARDTRPAPPPHPRLRLPIPLTFVRGCADAEEVAADEEDAMLWDADADEEGDEDGGASLTAYYLATQLPPEELSAYLQDLQPKQQVRRRRRDGTGGGTHLKGGLMDQHHAGGRWLALWGMWGHGHVLL